MRYEYSLYRLPMPLLRFVAVATAVVGVVFLLGVSTQMGWLVAAILGWIALSYPTYRFRVRALDDRGVDLPAQMRALHANETERAEAGSRRGREE